MVISGEKKIIGNSIDAIDAKSISIEPSSSSRRISRTVKIRGSPRGEEKLTSLSK